MIKKDDRYGSESGNWNVADDYAKAKIMRPLYLADEYEAVAIFGFEDFLDELQINLSNDEIRLKGFIRLVDCLRLLIDNSYFAVRKGKGDKVLDDYRNELLRIQKIIPRLYTKKTNQLKKTTSITLNENFQIVLARVIEIKKGINKPLNQNNLIFIDKKEFDPKEYKNSIKDRMRNQG